MACKDKKIINWIYENLQGRFYFGDAITQDAGKGKMMQMQKRAAFEIHSEASYFALVLPELNKF